YAAQYVKSLSGKRTVDAGQVEAGVQGILRPFQGKGNENPYAVHADLQECMQSLVGIIRTEGELKKALEEIGVFTQRLGRVTVEGGRAFNPAWHLTLDLLAMLAVSEATTLAALERKESRGGHTRDDYPKADPKWGKVNVVLRRKNGEMSVSPEPLLEMPDDLKKLVEEKK
ncbi:MAG: fumarate reductase/succinate dehydrogenase flavoprotein subunit, partial [candidate division NC10 bacterium]